MKMNNQVRASGSPTLGKTILKLSALSLSMLCLTLAHAEDTNQPTKVEKVTVTGSSIKGVAAQSASPITVIKGDDLAKLGITSVESALAKVSSNQAGFSTSQNVGTSQTSGSTANLRGLGDDKTLVLLNGRRLASSPFSTSTTDLNVIPMAMVDRIEVLRDGASAIYGADAIGGVINFITKKSFEGLRISAGATQPEDKGGESQDISIFGGYGDLDEQGYNVYGVVDYRRTNNIMAKDRKISRRGGDLPELGLSLYSRNGFPANFYDPAGGGLGADGKPKGLVGNPYANANCSNTPNVITDGDLCYLNTQALIGITPETETVSVLGRGTFKLSDKFNAIGEYVFSHGTVTSGVAPDVYNRTVTIPGTSQYYPGLGITPDVAGVSGDPLQLYLRSQAGNRINETTTDSHRAFVGIEGEAYGWDINGGVTYAKSEATDRLVSGYLNQSKVQAALDNGTLNPFGPSGSSNLWNSFNVVGDTSNATLDSTTVDFTVSRPIYTLPAGDVGFALGGSYTKQDWEKKVNAEVVRQVPSTGTDPDAPTSKGDRNNTAVFTEFSVPILKNLEAQIAARYDDYSDFGDTFNPKFALRWEPMKQLMLRTSYSTGFRAPSLYDINEPQSRTNTSNFDDPVLCPGGEPTQTQYKTECNTQFDRMQGGNKDLQPEESTSYTAGLVFEPIKNLVFTADYYNIKVDKLIDTVTDTLIFADPAKYADLFHRNADGRIDYVQTTLVNMGGIKTQGVDLSLNYLTQPTSTGRFGFGIDGTYVIKFDKQDEKGGEWVSRNGTYYNQQVYARWKHVANVNWSFEDWKMIFEQQFQHGYKDANATGDDQYDHHRVGDYTRYNIATTYSGFKNLELTGGIKNIFNQDPPASNVTDNFQYGYDTTYADVTGRAYYVRATYKF